MQIDLPVIYLKDVEVYYIEGPDSAKNRERAEELMLNFVEKFGNEYDEVIFSQGHWEGVQDDGNIALYDKFDDRMVPFYEFLRFIDTAIRTLQVENGSQHNNYKLVILTSEKPLDQIYPDANEAIKTEMFGNIKRIVLEEEKSKE